MRASLLAPRMHATPPSPPPPRNALFNADECLDNDDSFIPPPPPPTTQTDTDGGGLVEHHMNSDNQRFLRSKLKADYIYNNAEAALPARMRIGLVGERGARFKPRLRRLPSSEQHSS